MTFINASLLAGAALVAMPIVLHLIMRRKPKLLEFPALRFIQQQRDVNQRRLLLRHLLLLLLRAAVIALLAFALAQPSVRFSAGFSGALGSQQAPVATAMIFDTAPRMEYRHQNRTRLEAAQEMGQWLLKQLPSQSQIAVLDTRLGPAAFQVDRGAARQRIERLETVANSQPLPGVLEEALRLLGQSKLRKEVYLFTDLSRGAWPTHASASLQDRLAEFPGVGIYLIDVGVPQPIDFGLGPLRLSGQVLSNRSTLSIETEISRSGPQGQCSVELYLMDDQRKFQKRNEASYTLPQGESQQVDFRIGSLGLGTHQGYLRIVGQDGLACDDARFFTVEVKPAWRILLAAPKPAQRYALFLGEALAPSVFRKRDQARFDCQVVDLAALAEQPLDDVAAVCLLDPTPLEPNVWKKLGDFAAEGHGVAIFLGRNADPVDAFNAPLAQELLPGKLLRQARAPAGDVCLAPRGDQHPILSPFGQSAGSIPWDAFPVYRYWQLGEPAAGATVVVPLTDGGAALWERPVGAGRVLTMTTPVSDDPNRDPWNLLPVGEAWPFLILTNQMALYLVGSSDQELNYFAGQTALLALDPQQEHQNYLLTMPDDLKFRVSADLKQHVLAITSTGQVGNYRVQAGGTADGVDRGFSVNLAPEQTQLDRVGKQDLVAIFGKTDFRIARTSQEIERDVNSGRVGRELYGPIILLVALILAIEHLVANRFYKR